MSGEKKTKTTQSKCKHGNKRHTYLNLRHADGKETRQTQERWRAMRRGKFEWDAALKQL